MHVETYEAISLDVTKDGSVINELVSEESLALIESLGLTGQQKLTRKHLASDGEETLARSPYRQMTSEEEAVYRAILPRKVRLSAYADGPIPLRVLQVAAHAKDLFGELMVWCPRQASDPDPLLIGINDFHSWQEDGRERFMLARWGEVLEPFETLREKAAPVIRSRVVAAAEKVRAELDTFIAMADVNVRSYLLGNTVDGVHASVTMIG